MVVETSRNSLRRGRTINLPFVTTATLSLAWQFFANRDPFVFISVVASYYRFEVKVQEFPGGVAISTRKIGGSVVRDCAKVKIAKLFPGVFVGDSRKNYARVNFPHAVCIIFKS